MPRIRLMGRWLEQAGFKPDSRVCVYTASQTQSTMRSQIVSGNGSVMLDAKQDVTVAATGNATINAGSHLSNAGGSIAAGQKATVSAASNTFDNSAGGTFQTNSTDLTLAPATLDNDGGTITHAGTGTLTLNAGNGAGSISNAGGTIQSNGKVMANAGALNNASGKVIAQTGLAATVGNALNNTNGSEPLLLSSDWPFTCRSV
ncbi:hypothetical protein [Caballeronia sp. J97]|uniref:hypothetical protein n=1 Tax=Caballeronia sp. J97 TaxID=2805429 RepID=UPI0039EE289F